MESDGRPKNSSAFVTRIDDICTRCGGLMVHEHYMDLQDDTGQIGVTALRCTSCGDVIDPVILQNRMRPAAPNLLYGTKRRQYAQRIDEGGSDGAIGMAGSDSAAGRTD